MNAFSRLFTYARPYRGRFVAAVAAMLFYERERREDLRVQRHVRAWYAYLDELDTRFTTHDWLVLDRMSFADVHLYATVSVSQAFGMRVGERRALLAWLDRMNGRDSVQRSAPEPLMPVA